jgi:hypothetical protein
MGLGKKSLMVLMEDVDEQVPDGRKSTIAETPPQKEEYTENAHGRTAIGGRKTIRGETTGPQGEGTPKSPNAP